MREVYNLVVLSLYSIILAGLGFAAALNFKVLINLDFKIDFRVILEAAVGLILSTIIEDLIFQIILGAAIGITLEVALRAINIIILEAK